MRNNFWFVAIAIGIFIQCTTIVNCYSIPDVHVEIIPNGFKLSIPDADGVETVAFNVNINEAFHNLEEGELSEQIRASVGNRWTSEFKRPLRSTDSLYVWISVQRTGAVYTRIYGKLNFNDVSTMKPPTVVNKNICRPSITESKIFQWKQLCRDQLIFEDEFDNFNRNVWTSEIRLPLDDGDAEFVVYNDIATVNDGLLTIKPKLWTDDPNVSITTGTYAIGERCTGRRNPEKECHRQAAGYGLSVLPPIITARINTQYNFSFKYGRIEIRAKVPIGDWIIPYERGINWAFFKVIFMGNECHEFKFLSALKEDNIWQAESIGLSGTIFELTTLVNFNEEVLSTVQYYQVSKGYAKKIEQKDVPEESNCDVVMRNKMTCETLSETVSDYGKKDMCKGDIIFQDTFDDETELNHNKWNPEIRHRLYQSEEEFVFYNDSEKLCFVKDGNLHIRPVVPDGRLNIGSLSLNEKCTPTTAAMKSTECTLAVDSSYKVLPPVHSALISTKNSFRFTYGRVEVRAKVPKGKWIIPYIMLVPMADSRAPQIRIAFVRGNENAANNQGEDIGGKNLYGGSIIWPNDMRSDDMVHFKGNEHLGDAFHLYSINWSRDGIQLSIDGTTYGTVKKHIGLLQEQFYIVFGVSAGGHTEFKDIPAKPWDDSSPRAALMFWRRLNEWKNSWNGNESLLIDFVKVYAI